MSGQIQFQSNKKWSIGKKIGVIGGIVVAVLVIIFLIIAAIGSNSSSSSSTATSEPIKVATIMDDYIYDINTANSKYKDKTLTVTGQVVHKNQFNNSSDYSIYVYNKEAKGQDFTFVIDIPADKVSEVNKVKIGDFVTVTGKCIDRLNKMIHRMYQYNYRQKKLIKVI